MAFSKFNSVWPIISKYSLNVDIVSANEDLKCVICNKLMRDACLSSSCGCQYCYECIDKYMDGEEKYCPGVKEDCKDIPIVIFRNVVRSELLNRRISKLKAKCPNESCTSTIELIKMEDHLRLCTKQSVKCQHVTIGCNCEPMKESTELKNEDLNSEINKLKEDNMKCKLELTDKENRIASLEEKLNREIEIRVNLDKQTTGDIDELRRQMENVRIERDTVASMLTELSQNLLMMTVFNEELRNKEDRMILLDEELLALRNEIELRINEILVTMETKINDRKRRKKDRMIETKSVPTITIDKGKDVDEMSQLKKNCDEENGEGLNLCQNVAGDFLWKIDHLSEKIDKHLYSESFYSNNYKLCLCLWIDSFSNDLFFCCYLMKGDYDNTLQWPMAGVTLSIIDQVTLSTFKKLTYRNKANSYNRGAFNRPKSDRNKFSIGPWSSFFFKYSSIKNKPSIIVNDSIIVSCIVTDL